MTNNPDDIFLAPGDDELLARAEGDAAFVLAAIMRRALDGFIVAAYDWPADEQRMGTPYVVHATTRHGYPYRITIDRIIDSGRWEDHHDNRGGNQ